MAKFFIHRPVFAIVISLVILLAGAVSIPSLPIAQYPQITPPTINVSANYTGANAQVLQETVAAPIEQQVNGAEGMLYMRSVCTNSGNYSLTVTFDLSRNQDLAAVDIQNRVNQASSLLPSEVVQSGITVAKQSTQQLVYITMYSGDNSRDSVFVSNYATINVKDQLARIAGVGSASIIAGQRDYSMRIWVRPDILSKLKVTSDDLISAVSSQNVQAAAGSLGDPPQAPGLDIQYPVNVRGRLIEPQEFGNIIVRTEPNGGFLRVDDVANCELGASNYSSLGIRGKSEAVIIAVYQLPDANGVELAKKVIAKMEELSENFPSGVDYEIAYDSTIFVTKSIEEVVSTLFEAIVLVLIVVFVFLGNFRATVVPILAVPVSLVGTFAGFAVLGFSINLLTMFGLVLAVGIVVDDAIVVVEAVESHIEHGLSPVEATERAMDEVSGPVIAIALVLCSVFVPVAFMGGMTGLLYQQFAVTLAVSVCLSALVALTLTPALCVLILRPRKPMWGPLGWFLRGFDRVFGWVTGGYVFFVKQGIRYVVITLVLLGLVYYSAFDLMTTTPTGFIPNEDMGSVMVNVTLPAGASLERTQKVCNQVTDIVTSEPAVRNTIGLVGYNIIQGTLSANAGAVIAPLKDWDERPDSKDQVTGELIASLQKKLSTVASAQIQVFGPPPISGLSTTSGVTMELQDRSGGTIQNLYDSAVQYVGQIMQGGKIRLAYTMLNPSIPMVNVEVDRDKLMAMGIPVKSAFTAMQVNLGGYFVNQFNQFGRAWRVFIQAESRYRRQPSDVGSIYLRGSSGEMVPLSTVCSVSETTGTDVITRYNLYPTAEINAEAAPGISSGQAMAAMEEAALQLPQGYGYEWTGTAYQEKLASGQTMQILGLGLIFVFLFLSAQYESWGIPFSVLLGMPVVVFGAVIGIRVIGMDLNVYVQIGILMLIGLSAKNAILIVEYAKANYEQKGMELTQAALEAARVRLRPIMMTSFAFIMGVVPLVVAEGASAVCRRALGTSVFSGMLAASVIGIFFIPCLYVYIQYLIDLVGGKSKKAQVAEAAAGSQSGQFVQAVTPEPAAVSSETVKPSEPVVAESMPANPKATKKSANESNSSSKKTIIE